MAVSAYGRMMLSTWMNCDEEQPEPHESSRIRVRNFNGGLLAERYLYQCDRDDQKVALWAPEGASEIRGVLFCLGRATEAYRTDLQAFARSRHFAVYAALIRWADFEYTLPAQLAELSQALNHPEIVNVPWVCICGSRNVAACCEFARHRPERILCILGNGGPGMPVDLEHDRIFDSIPILTVNGSIDPYVDGTGWLEQVYPTARQAKLPWCAAVEWGTGHAPEQNNRLHWPFVNAVMEKRFPKNTSSKAGPVKLLPFPESAGYLLDSVDWKKEWGGSLSPAADYRGDRNRTVWFPDQVTAQVWRAFVSRDEIRLNMQVIEPAGGLRCWVEGVSEETIRSVAIYSGENRLYESSGAFEFVWPAVEAYGVQLVYAIAQMKSGPQQRSQPVLAIDGNVIDQRTSMRQAQGEEAPEKVVDLPDSTMQTVKKLLAEDRTISTCEIARLEYALRSLRDSKFAEQRNSARPLLDLLIARRNSNA